MAAITDIKRVSTAADGTEGDYQSVDADFSPDGTQVAFASAASNLVPGDTNGADDIFVKDLVTGAVSLVSTAADGTQGSSGSYAPVFSPDGTQLAFGSYASNLVPDDTNDARDIFIVTLAGDQPPRDIIGTLGDDDLTGTAAAESIRGLDGDDTIRALGGGDRVTGDAGDDTLDGGEGDDKLYGGSGDDIVRGGEGNDWMKGEDGDDALYGENGADRIFGGDGDDYAKGGAGDDTIHGEDGDDILHGDVGDDTLDGGDGDDKLYGGSGSDVVRGGDGGDWIKGESGDDVLYGDAGDDTLDGGAGDDLLIDGAGCDAMRGGAGADVFRLVRDGDRDEIRGFGAGDRIDLSLWGVGYADLVIEQLRPDRVLIAAGDERLVVKGDNLVAADLDASKFIFGAQPEGRFGLVGWAGTPRGHAQAIAVDGDFAYVGEFNHDSPFCVFDVSDPTNPLLRGVYWTGQEVDEIDLVDGAVYIANDANGVVRVDVSDPDNPRPVEGRSDGTYASSFAVDERGFGFAGYFYNTGRELAIYDMSAFPDARPVATYAAAGEYHVANLEVSGERAYLVTGDMAGVFFEIVDVSDPAAPRQISKLATDIEDYGNWIGDFDVVDNFAFLPRTPAYRADSDGGLLVVDIGDETAPVVAAFLPIPDAGQIDYRGVGLDVEDGRAYLASQTGLYVIDVTDPYAPVIIADPNVDSSFRFPEQFLPSEGGYVDVQGDYAYVTSYLQYSAVPDPDAGGLAIFRIGEDGVLL